MPDDIVVKSSRVGYYAAMLVGISVLGVQFVRRGSPGWGVFAVVLVGQVGYWGAYAYYRRRR